MTACCVTESRLLFSRLSRTVYSRDSLSYERLKISLKPTVLVQSRRDRVLCDRVKTYSLAVLVQSSRDRVLCDRVKTYSLVVLVTV